MSIIVDEAPGYIQVFSDGTVKRFSPEIATASAESTDGFKSKDVVIDPSKPITGRIYVPDLWPETEQVVELLPVLLYFHGGGFCVGSTSWLGYHLFLGGLSVQSKSVVVSVDYRLAPENKLPIAYEDCYAALEWVQKNQRAEPYLESADLSRVFLAGDSAGGNIVAKKCLQEENCAVKIKGIMPIHPYFGSERRTAVEVAAEGSSGSSVAMNDMFWRLSLPEGYNRDFYGCNLENDRELSAGEWLRFPAALVFVAGKDFLKERGGRCRRKSSIDFHGDADINYFKNDGCYYRARRNWRLPAAEEWRRRHQTAAAAAAFDSQEGPSGEECNADSVLVFPSSSYGRQ
nr:probable carboxylesterase 17 [Ipomoea batatas]